MSKALTTQRGRISLAHGNGGRRMRELILEVFARRLANPHLDTDNDAATVPVEGDSILMTTDGFTVQPLEFPGGDIGTLAVYGTVNDLAVAGAVPRYLCLNVFVEEGFEIARLARIIESTATAAHESGVAIVTGDTKVLPHGGCDGLFLATSGVGVRRGGFSLGMHAIAAGDAILVSGPIGDHGTAIMLAREQFGLHGVLNSDCSNVTPLAAAPYDLPDPTALRFMRDPSRGGLACVLHEIATRTDLGMQIDEASVPVRPSVRAVCEMLGFDPYYLACEGRVVAVIATEVAEELLRRWRALPQGRDAAIIGRMVADTSQVELHTAIGGRRLIEELEDDPLPRIC